MMTSSALDDGPPLVDEPRHGFFDLAWEVFRGGSVNTQLASQLSHQFIKSQQTLFTDRVDKNRVF